MHLLLLFNFLFFFSGSAAPGEVIKAKTSTAPTAEKLQWLTLPQALEKTKAHPKKILIDIYTDWCGYCKRMDKQVYQHPEIVAKLNKDYYVVKLNAELRDPVTIDGKTYKYLQKYRAHELALSLLNGEMSYPSTVFLNEKQQIMERVPGFIPPKDFLRALAYLSEK
ncbi:thioredoxin family protein [Rufibacter radiotolerans]|uniref:thioredoxin family protein n=1 Tax=Rufibacter radiotolerans TaxID=1379910 RepID=UPI0009715206|nr:thioredoxin family protein [Rufibacter radiotolerans]